MSLSGLLTDKSVGGAWTRGSGNPSVAARSDVKAAKKSQDVGCRVEVVLGPVTARKITKENITKE